MTTVSGIEVVSAEEAQELALPASVQETLGELVHCAKEGLLALSVGVGLGVVAEMMAEEVDEVVGPKGKHNPERTAVRHGHEAARSRSTAAACRSSARCSADGESEVPLDRTTGSALRPRAGSPNRLHSQAESAQTNRRAP